MNNICTMICVPCQYKRSKNDLSWFGTLILTYAAVGDNTVKTDINSLENIFLINNDQITDNYYCKKCDKIECSIKYFYSNTCENLFFYLPKGSTETEFIHKTYYLQFKLRDKNTFRDHSSCS